MYTSFAAFYLTRLLRELPGLKELAGSGVKPLSCDVCMAFWTSLAVTFLPTRILSRAGRTLWLLAGGEPNVDGVEALGD